METPTPVSSDASLLELLNVLKQRHYRFVTPTPATYARVLARPGRELARNVEDVLGWSLPFQKGILPPELFGCLTTANVIEETEAGLRSTVRVSSLGHNLFLHSAYPTQSQDAVFFGPDTYRFANLILRELGASPATTESHIVDIGTGAGVGAIVAAIACPQARITMTDVNPEALRLARINAQAAGVGIKTIETAALDDVDGGIDIVTINPPYIIDEDARTYRDGGGMHGAELSVELTDAALERLTPRGRIILYTGSAIVDGRDALHEALSERAAGAACSLRYSELDPDVFGEELEKQPYADVDRIALVAAILERSR